MLVQSPLSPSLSYVQSFRRPGSRRRSCWCRWPGQEHSGHKLYGLTLLSESQLQLRTSKMACSSSLLLSGLALHSLIPRTNQSMLSIVSPDRRGHPPPSGRRRSAILPAAATHGSYKVPGNQPWHTVAPAVSLFISRFGHLHSSLQRWSSWVRRYPELYVLASCGVKNGSGRAMVELLQPTWGLLLCPRLAVYHPIWWRERVMARKQRGLDTGCAMVLVLLYLELLHIWHTHLHRGLLQLSTCSHSSSPGMADAHLCIGRHPTGTQYRSSLWHDLSCAFSFVGSLSD